ncbi:MAG: phenylalanine--tRNA ligase subunit beta [Spirochaetes bacterium]|nr:MAG: phenylalanine--tRNA ligase subunit beta [Spirochaetota bacterium]
MPIVTISAKELKELIGKDLPREEIEEILPLNKMEIDSWDGDEISVEVTPDRPDFYSVEGIARQLRAWLYIKPGLPSHILSKPQIRLHAQKVSSRPCIVAGIVRELEMNEPAIKSLLQLQELLDLSLGRDRKKVSIGIHDLDKIKPPLTYTEVDPETTRFVPLSCSKEMSMKEIIEEHPKGIEYKHLLKGAEKFPVVFDCEDVISFPPIINSERTRITENTKNIFIEITGTDESAINYALNIIMTALEERGGKLEAVRINNTQTPHLKAKAIKFEPQEAKRLLGINLKNSELKSLLERMCYDVDLEQKTVFAPPYRFDILHPIDVIEDIAIAYGYNDFTPEVPKLPTIGKEHPKEEFSNTLRELMIGLGFQEIVNHILTSPEKMIKKPGINTEEAIEIANPVTSEYSVCRTWLLPGLFQNLANNKHRRYPQKLFEIGDAVLPKESSDTRTSNQRKLSGVISHSAASLSEIISVINALLENLGLKPNFKTLEHPTFISGRCGRIIIGEEEIGFFGEVHPKVLTAFELKMPVSGFEIDVEKLMDIITSTNRRASQKNLS